MHESRTVSSKDQKEGMNLKQEVETTKFNHIFTWAGGGGKNRREEEREKEKYRGKK